MPRQDCIVWRPDTCGCEVLINSQGKILDEKQVRAEQMARIAAKDPTVNRTPLRTLRDICPEHQNQGHMQKDAALLTVINEENRRKNNGLQTAIDHIPGLELDDIDWSLDGDRVLILNLPQGKCDSPQANALRGLYTAAFGPGKVIVNRVEK